ncbi:hypothetical protein GQ42DRAFT_158938 [Ramicandelaber brevisporus]|nr:hypothetical protein GQ42DRAFT_158938 [Ramicandelaber brevisporus]
MYIETIQSHRRHQWIQSVLFSLLAVLGTAATACAVITFANLSNFLTAASANGITGYVAVIGAISCIAALILLAFAQTLAKRSSRLLQLIGRNQQSQLQQHSQQQQQQQYQDDDMQHYQLPIGGIGDLNLDHKKRSVIGIQSNNSGDYYHLSRFNRRKHRASLLSLRSSHSDLRRSSRSSVGNSVKSWWDSVKNYFTNHGNGRRHHQKHQHHLVQLNMVKGSSACAVNAVCEQTTNCDCGQSLPRAISWNRWISGSMAVLWVAAAMGMMTIDNSFRSALGCNLPAIVAISAPSSIPTTAASSTTSRIVASVTPKQTSSASTVSRSTLDDKTKIADSFNPLAPAAVVGKADPHHQQSPRTVKMAISKQSMDALARALLTAMDEVTAEQIIEAERSYQQQQQQQHSTPHPQYMQELYRRHFVLAAAPTPTATSSSAASSGTASATVSAKTSSGSATTSKPSTVGKQIGNNRGVSTASSASSPITRISISPDIAHRDNIQSGCSVTRATYALSFVLGALWTVALIHSIVVFSSKTATPADGSPGDVATS